MSYKMKDMNRNRFIETICFEDGRFARLPYHARRMNQTRREIFGMETPLSLEEVLDAQAATYAVSAVANVSANTPANMPVHTLADTPANTSETFSSSSAAALSPLGRLRVKCRVEYAARILDVSYTLYHPRPVGSLRLVEAAAFDYRYKSADRRELQALFDRRGEADDILLTRHGELTDTSIGNIALFDGTAWHTPSRPLLAGTRRAALLDAGLLSPRRILAADLCRYTRIRIFNALLDFGEIDLPVEAILA